MFSKTVIICTSLISSLNNLLKKKEGKKKNTCLSFKELSKDLRADAVVRFHINKA